MKLQKTLAAVAGFFMALTLGACGGANQADGGSTKAAGDTFTVGFDAEFPPYGFKDDSGEYTGFDLDLAAEVAKRNEWTMVPQPIDWDAKDMELKSGTIDCIWNGFTMDGREDDYTWSRAYVNNEIVFAVKKDSAIKSTADLAGKNVLVQADSSGLAALENEENKAITESFKDLTQVANYNDAFLTIDSGGAQAVAIDSGVARYQLMNRANGDEYTIVQFDSGYSEKYGIGFKKGNTALRDQVQKTIDEMIDDGTFAQIAEKWGIQDSIITEK
ncbi:MAG: amino acid ABC transporter substrate-binding protein [Varibaculum sp.]|nr:amino acid ABC transporter substrate-binding protein [Varibaculum sp.]